MFGSRYNFFDYIKHINYVASLFFSSENTIHAVIQQEVEYSNRQAISLGSVITRRYDIQLDLFSTS